MIDVNLLKSAFVGKGHSQGTFCDAIDMSQSTFSRRMKKGYFRTDEVKRIIDELKLSDEQAIKIFCPKINLTS